MGRLTLLLLAICAGSPAWAGCAPERLIKVVYRDVTPDLDPDSFEAKPKTLYRLGARYGRLEELPDPSSGIHRLTVTYQPDSWVVDLAGETGRHIVDPGPSFALHAPVLGFEGVPPLLRELEFGCEIAFFRAHRARREDRAAEGGSASRRERVLEVDGTRLVLVLDETSGKPAELIASRGGKPLQVVRYELYEDDLPVDLDLFRAPPGIAYEEERIELPEGGPDS